MTRLAVFDWNGTLLSDTIAQWKAVNAHYTQVYGRAPLTLARFRETYTMPVTRMHAQNGIPEKACRANLEREKEMFHTHYEMHARRARLRKGARPLLQRLSDQGVTRAILSNHTEHGIRAQLERLKIEGFFDAVLANSDRKHTGIVDKGTRLESYLAKKQAAAQDTVLIGDTVEEIEIARRAGATSIAITGGCHAAARLRAAKPDFLVGNLAQAEKIIAGQ